jgi:hypothetical protein
MKFSQAKVKSNLLGKGVQSGGALLKDHAVGVQYLLIPCCCADMGLEKLMNADAIATATACVNKFG